MYFSKEERALLKETLIYNCNDNMESLTEASNIDPIEGDGQVPVEDDNITVEVDGEVVTDPTPEEVDNSDKDALDGYGPKLAITDMLL